MIKNDPNNYTTIGKQQGIIRAEWLEKLTAAFDAAVVERERCAMIADVYQDGLLEYPSHEARQHYEAGVQDAAMGIARLIRGERNDT